MTNKKWDQSAVMKMLQKKREEESSSGADQRFWNPTASKKGKVVYRVRILPNMKAGGQAWIKILRHGFQTPSGGWFIENCPATLGQKCPVDEYAGPFFKTGDSKDENFARSIYRKKNYIANILVIKDPRENGANEGKVFLWRFGQKIFNKLDSTLFPPEDSGLEQLMFIDPYTGYDLNVVVTLTKDGNKEYPNYDESVFVRESTPIGKTEEEVDRILGGCYDLEGEFLAPKQFKSYEELKKLFDAQVVNFRKPAGSEQSVKQEKKEQRDETPQQPEPKKEEKKPATPPPASKNVEEKVEETDDDFLKSLEKELNG